MLTDLGDAPLPDVMGISDKPSLETMVLTSLGRAHFQAGNIGPAREWLERALLSDGAAYSTWRIHGLGALALLEAWSGRTNAPRTWPAKPWRRLDSGIAVAPSRCSTRTSP